MQTIVETIGVDAPEDLRLVKRILNDCRLIPDYLEHEPLSDDSPFGELQNCLLAPHSANSSLEARKRVHESTIENLLRALREVDDHVQ